MAIRVILLLFISSVACGGCIGSPVVTYSNPSVAYNNAPINGPAIGFNASPLVRYDAPAIGHQETGIGDGVQGSYSLVEPDGTRRTIEYAADSVNAILDNVPTVVKSPAGPSNRAPVISYTAAPIAQYTTQHISAPGILSFPPELHGNPYSHPAGPHVYSEYPYGYPYPIARGGKTLFAPPFVYAGHSAAAPVAKLRSFSHTSLTSPYASYSY